MALPFTSLDGATSTGPGEVRDLEAVAEHHTAVVWATGSPTSVQVLIQGSHDGETWLTVDTFNTSSGAPVVRTVPTTDAPTHLWRYVRANLATLSGGSAPAVTVTIASDVSEED